MSTPDPRREFAVEVVSRLREKGFEALWAGGCVRDFLLGKTPKDFDVATNATPDVVRRLFGPKRTVPVGAAFGVIMVLGPSKDAGQVEVATFRSEGPYLDGRRPSNVAFSTAEQDAHRRDFTINGMFYDPIEARVIDYVGGEADLARGVLRAIGNPIDRMTEDKLRMLRAVRFAATLEFEFDAATRAAVQGMAPQIHVVSAERIAQELRRMLVDLRRRRAMELAADVGLIREVFPEVGAVDATSENEWQQTLQMLHLLQEPTFELAFAALVHRAADGSAFSQDGGEALAQFQSDRRHKGDAVWSICRRLKLSNEESEAITWLVAQRCSLRGAPSMAFAELKRKLSHPLSFALIELFRVETLAHGGDLTPVTYSQDYLRNTPREVLDPQPLLGGNDLKPLGIPPGPAFKEWLDNVRDAQLNGEVSTREEALAWIRSRRG
jgi:poly(A) polymerase